MVRTCAFKKQHHELNASYCLLFKAKLAACDIICGSFDMRLLRLIGVLGFCSAGGAAHGSDITASCLLAARDLSPNSGEPEIAAVTRACRPGTIFTLISNGSTGPLQVARLCNFEKAVVTLGPRTICVLRGASNSLLTVEPLAQSVKSLDNRIAERGLQQAELQLKTEATSIEQAALAERVKQDVVEYFRIRLKRPITVAQRGSSLTFTTELGRILTINCQITDGRRRFAIRYEDTSGRFHSKLALDDEQMLDAVLEWSRVS